MSSPKLAKIRAQQNPFSRIRVPGHPNSQLIDIRIFPTSPLQFLQPTHETVDAARAVLQQGGGQFGGALAGYVDTRTPLLRIRVSCPARPY